ncbi:hypothetical protein [Sandaracinus amylolyticus]|uniref:Type II secretory pathway, ATPase PulE/Tfp pilus assembly pathway, ATPase PilB n=1 Tax=Sandaracinus amylolyticus TaxID=927083 RepID=A0A0F6YK38_9BACT|nr:hypothetical protein [Sandaracinus amylolyticus]AKF06832.1 Type II secretory pathway, ATPase PulE/Tfp pilus assembly pathway, ATPase PilB [Sandaracinus amylolyticus]
MADDLGARLLRAGLVTRDQLAETLATAPAHGGALVSALVARGVPEDAIAGFFLADGFGPLMEADDLAKADPGARRRLPGAMASDLLAMPVRSSPAGLVVAMAAPSDRHAVREIARVVGSDVLPTVACVRALRAAIGDAYPDQAKQDAAGSEPPLDDRPTLVESEPPVLELVRRRTSGETPAAGTAPLGPRLIVEDDEPALPLVRTKPQHTPPRGVEAVPAPVASKVVSKAFARPEGVRRMQIPAAPVRHEGRGTAEYPAMKDDPEPTSTPSPPPSTPSPPPSTPAAEPSTPAPPTPSSLTPRPTSIVPPEHERWDFGGPSSSSSPAPPPRKLTPKVGPRARSELPSARSTLPEVGTVLAAIRGAPDRDSVVRLACEGAVTVARTAIFLALRKGVLKGWEGTGGGLTHDAVRNLWIPTTSASMLKDVVEHREAYVGPYGTAVADGLFRAAVGSRGGDVALHPVVVSDHVVGVLCADDVLPVPIARQRIELLAHAVGEAFKRIIVERKG